MEVGKCLNSKQVTRCTLRFYDPKLANDLEILWKKIGGTQNDFFTMLIKEGYKSISPLYEHINLPVIESVKRVQGENVEKLIQELKELFMENSVAEIKAINGLFKETKVTKKMLSCALNLLTMLNEDDETLKAFIERGGMDKIPTKFVTEPGDRDFGYTDCLD